jgi:FkbM family methyltransferase
LKFTLVGDQEEPLDFECADTYVSRWVCGNILEGETYPFLPFVDDVHIVFDVGANCGAAAVFFARHYPRATVHAFEPAQEPLNYLRRNAAGSSNVRVHAFGLHSCDQVVPLYKGDGDTILGSVVRRGVNLDEHELVELRDGGAWAAAEGIARVEVLKVDVELCEVDVLEGLQHLLPTVKVLYVEYDSRVTRRGVAELVRDTHELYAGTFLLDQGECVYVRRDLADQDCEPAVPGLADAMPFLPFVGDAGDIGVVAGAESDEIRRHLGAMYGAARVVEIDDPARMSPSVKVVYAEFASNSARAGFERATDATHELYLGNARLDHGTGVYLRQDLAGLASAHEYLETVVRDRWTARVASE